MKSFRIKINGKSYHEKNFVGIPGDKPGESGQEMEHIVLFIEEWLNGNDFILNKTSGSTGIPKEIKMPKQAMLQSAKMTCDFFNLTAGINALLCLPVEYIAGKMMIVRAIYGGFNLVVAKPVSNPFKEIAEKIDFAALTPYQLHKSIDTLAGLDVSNIIIGGAPVSRDIEQEILNLNSSVFETYGMTETCSHIALRKLNGNDGHENFKTLENVNLDVDNRGCLMINVPGVTDGFITTNDLVELVNTNHFKWLGRYDHVINSGGIKIYPEQVEKKLNNIIDRPFFIGSKKDRSLGEKVVLILEGKPMDKEQEDLLMKQIADRLSRFEIPKEIVYKDFFEKTGSGKIKRVS